MSRVQLALRVADLDAAVDFYSRLFDSVPAKRRPGYANFAVANPPLKLVLFENPGASPLNHLGVEVSTPADVVAAAERFASAGLRHTTTQTDRCCHAVQDKVWVSAPDVPLGAWEFYAVIAEDLPTNDDVETDVGPSACCASTSTDTGPCCGAGPQES